MQHICLISQQLFIGENEKAYTTNYTDILTIDFIIKVKFKINKVFEEGQSNELDQQGEIMFYIRSKDNNCKNAINQITDYMKTFEKGFNINKGNFEKQNSDRKPMHDFKYQVEWDIMTLENVYSN